MFGLDGVLPTIKDDLAGLFPNLPPDQLDMLVTIWDKDDEVDDEDDPDRFGSVLSHNNDGDAEIGLEESDIEVMTRVAEPDGHEAVLALTLSEKLGQLGMRMDPEGMPCNSFLVGTGGRPDERIWAHELHVGTTYKCTCRRHTACSIMMLRCWLGDGAMFCKMYEWLSTAASMGETGHWRAGQGVVLAARAAGG